MRDAFSFVQKLVELKGIGYDNVILHYNTIMTTISVPIKAEEEKFIENYIKSGQAENKAQVFRRALRLLAEEEALARLLRSQEDVRQGKIFRGNFRKLLKKF